LNYGYTRPSVISRGPVPQNSGVPGAVMSSPTEVVPTPKPTLAEPLEEGELTPDDLPHPESMQTAELPASPILNAPVVHTVDVASPSELSSNPLRGKSLESGSLRLAPVRVRTASNASSPVRQATFTGTVTDGQ
jgi:hypothetical protein